MNKFDKFVNFFCNLPLLYKGFLTGFSLALFILIVIFNEGGGDISDNLVPEFIGLCLEGIFFVIIFSAYESRKEISKKEKFKKVLRANILILLNQIYKLVYDEDELKEPGVNYAIDPIYVKKLIEKNKERLTSKSFKDATEFLDTIKLEIHHWYSLYPVAGFIDADHFYAWQQITKSMEWIPKRSEGYYMHNEVQHFLSSVQKFDNLAINN